MKIEELFEDNNTQQMLDDVKEYLEDSPGDHLTELLVDHGIIKNERVAYEWTSGDKVDELMDYLRSNPKTLAAFAKDL